MRDKHKDDAIAQAADDAFAWWLLFDASSQGTTLAEHYLKNDPTLSPAERRFFDAVRHTTMQLYEIIAIEPGKGMTLRDVIHRHEVRVQERSVSQTLRAGDLIAARVVPKGASGQPELDGGLFPMRAEQRQSLIAQLKEMEIQFDAAERKSLLPMFFFDAWIAPPNLQNLNEQLDERWVDEPIPMLDGETPRDAATKPELRGRVAKLIEGLEEMHEKAREKGEAAWDPSGMWKELGLEDLAQQRSSNMR